MKYRADIDGLRAIAVLSVILFHINPTILPGGFVGVDIFFVISGYLITSLLVSEIYQTGTIDFWHFYRRRIQRIYPATVFVLVVVIFIGYFITTPDDYEKLLKSSLWSLLSAANLYFFKFLDTSYFSPSSNETPLLHLWSLGVEEQYYILWPPLLIISFKILKSVKHESIFFAVFFISSLLANEILRGSHFSFAYYMLPTRAWELMMGGLVALAIFKNVQINYRFLNVFSHIGFISIFFCLFFVDENFFIPGIGALPSVIGAALIIFSGHYKNNTISRIISNNTLVYIGLISFSAYLWHWPILALLNYSMIEMDFSLGVTVFLLTFGMAQFSYVFVESPLRKIKISPKKAIGYFFFVPCIIIGSYSFFSLKMISNKSSTLYDWSELDKAQQAVMPAYNYSFNCQASDFTPALLLEKRCVYPNKTNPKTILVGDSHGAHFVGMLRILSDYYGFSFRNATQSACSFIFSKNVNNISTNYKNDCKVYRSVMQQEVIKYENIIIGGMWSAYLTSEGKEFFKEFEKTIDFLAPKMKTIIIAEQIPLFISYKRQCEERSVRINLVNCNKRFNNKYQESIFGDFIKKLALKYPNIYIFDVSAYLCHKGNCSPYIEQLPIYYDSSHLSMEGSVVLGKIIAQNDIKKVLPFSNLN